MKIQKGDTVIMLSGKEKGKTGKVTATLPRDGKVLIEGLNVRTRHHKQSSKYPQGGIVKEPMPVWASKVGLLRGTSKDKASRVGYQIKKDKKVRVLKQSGNKEVK